MSTSSPQPKPSACPFSLGSDSSHGDSLLAQQSLDPLGCPISAEADAFDPFEGRYLQDPGLDLQWARQQQPIFWSPKLGYWIVTRYDDVKAVFRDNLTFSPAIALEKITPATPEVLATLQQYGFAMNRTMVNEDEPDHMARRRLLMDAFLPERLLRFEPIVRELTRQAIDRIIDRGHADLVREVFYEIPLNVALKFLGVPEAGAEQLRQFAVAHTLNTWGRPSPEQQIELAHQVGRFWQTAQAILSEMRADPTGEGWMYDTLRQHQNHPEIVTDSYLRSMMMAILAAAHETTSNAAANAFMTLLRQRSAWQALCTNPALIPNAVEECLRIAGSIIAWRRITTQDTTVGGLHLPRDSKLLLVQASANVDEAHFDRPNQIDLYRQNAVEHLTFGYGAHQCMGKNIGRMQLRIFLEEFVQRIPQLQLDDEQTFQFLPNTSFRGPEQLWVRWDIRPNTPADNPAAPLASFYVGPPPKDKITRPLVVREIERIGDTLYRLSLASPKHEALPAWQAGAHIDLIHGGYRRKYSLCGDPLNPGRYELVIDRNDSGRGGSRHFCDQLQAGVEVQVSGPKNLFPLNLQAEDTGECNAAPIVLVAGGIGITPIITMADQLQRAGLAYTLHYAGRKRQNMAWLARLNRDHGAHLKVYVSDEGAKLDLADLVQNLPETASIYACGPARMIHALQHLTAHWPEHRLKTELFQGDAANPAIEANQTFEVELDDSKLRLTVQPHQTLLEVLLAAGIDVPYDCGEGLCGSCEVKVLAGEVEHRDHVLSPAEKRSHQRLMVCCSRAKTPSLVLGL